MSSVRQQQSDKVSVASLLAIALPMIASQASETIMLFTDRLFLSHLGKLHMAAAMSGGLTAFVICSLFSGTIGYVNALTAWHYGAKEFNQCSRVTAQGIFFALLFYPLLILLIGPLRNIFVLAGHETRQIGLEYGYFSVLMTGSIFMLLRSALSGFFLGIGKTRIIMFANITGMIVNIAANYALIFGKWGFPAMGMQGAAWGTICGSFSIFIILAVRYAGKKYHREYLTRSNLKPDFRLCRRHLQYGFPAGMELFLNVTAFNIFLQLMHSYSSDVAAAVTIAFNWDMVAFIPMLGVGFAATSLVGRKMGACKPEAAESAGWLAWRAGMLYAACMMFIFIFFSRFLAEFFSGNFSAEENRKVLPLASFMIRLASVYTLADITQIILAGALRGAGDTRWVMKASMLMHWLMAILAFLFIRVWKLSPVSVWIMFIIIILGMGILMLWRFRSGIWKKIKVIEQPAGFVDEHQVLTGNL